MTFSFRRQPQSLDAWVAMATSGLCDDSRERIGEEIESHYTETLAKAEADGLDSAEARVQAVRSLGDPRRARRRLRRQHLTRLQGWVVDNIVRQHGFAQFQPSSAPITWRTKLLVLAAVVAPFGVIAGVLFGIGLFSDDLGGIASDSFHVFAGIGLCLLVGIAITVLSKWLVTREAALPVWVITRNRGLGKFVWFLIFLSIEVFVVTTEIERWKRDRDLVEEEQQLAAEIARTNLQLEEFKTWLQGLDAAEFQQFLDGEDALTREWLVELRSGVDPEPYTPTAIPSNLWGAVFESLVWVSVTAGNLAVAIWYWRLTAKLRRFGYDQPPSAMA
jgi:hypothetical protein